MSESQLNTTVTCVICNKIMKRITRTHLAQHGHTIESYQLEFPEAAITSEAELYRRANNFRNLNNENKGKKRDPEIGKRISEAKKAAKRSSWNKGLKLSSDKAKLRYGAFFNDILVAVMTFKPTSFVKGGDGSEWELSRFAVCNYSNIPGIASKMLKRFNADNNNPPLISYADARWSVGNVYTSIGFKFAGTTPPSYWYVDTNEWATREHRSRHMKHLILKRYPNSDPTKTEWEIMQDHKWDRVWDCGTLKYTMNVPE